ncbi:MAG: C45 family autoproteolytic acyltransferase/hydrolase [Gemmataceae bacterium]
MRLRCLVGLCVFAFVLPSLRADGPDPQTVVRYGPAYRYPQDGWTVLHLEGEPYERGYQHGQLMAREIEGYLKSLSAQQSSTSPSDAWKLTRTIVNASFLRKIGDEYLEEMKGTADGAAAAGATIHGRPVDLLDIVSANVSAEYDTLDGALNALPTGLEGKSWPKKSVPKAMPKPSQDHCSAFAATGPATKDGKIVFGHITMWSLYSTNFYNVWLDIKPAKGHRVLMQSFPGGIWSGMDYYLSSSGLMLTETTIQQTRFNPDGVPLADRARRAMQYANSIDEIVKILVEKNNGLYANEWMMGDANTNEIAILELGTNAHKLRRSSKNEWIKGGMPGFYWGCNNTKDLQVRLDTYASLNERPHDISWRPSDRDKAWLTLLKQYHGKIDERFGKLAFTTPPLAAHSSLDAKFTTTDMVKQLKTVALFGPPLGLAWRPNFDQQTRYPDIKPLISNDWTVLTAAKPHENESKKMAVDLGGATDKPGGEIAMDGDDDEGGTPSTHPVWTGTLIPKSDADLWVTSAFARYERIVAFELALKEKGNGKLSPAAQNQLDLQLFRVRSDYRAALATKPTPEPKTETEIEIDRARWHKQTVAYGILTLAALKEYVGDGPFVDAMLAYGRKNAGREITADDFISFVGKATNKDVVSFFRKWEMQKDQLAANHAVFHCQSFHEDLPHTIITYDSDRDGAANQEAAMELQKMIRERWTNFTVRVVSFQKLSEAERKENHLILIGRPATKMFNVSKSTHTNTRTFTANDLLYAHPGSAMIVTMTNPDNPRFSTIQISGNSANATWHLPEKLLNAPATDLVVFPANGGVKGMIRK